MEEKQLRHETYSCGIECWYDQNGEVIHEKDSRGTEYWYDQNGKVIHKKDSDGYECWYDYDQNGKVIHEKDSDGYEYWYDQNGKVIHTKDSDGYELWYDGNGKVIHTKDSCGTECWYDENGKVIHTKDSCGIERWHDYDIDGKIVHTKNSCGIECWYDRVGTVIHKKDSCGTECWYDQNGKAIHTKDSDGYEYWYDGNGKVIHKKYPDGSECWYDYDSNGKIVHTKDSRGTECWYDENGKGVHEKYPDGSEFWYDENGNVSRGMKDLNRSKYQFNNWGLYPDGSLMTLSHSAPFIPTPSYKQTLGSRSDEHINLSMICDDYNIRTAFLESISTNTGCSNSALCDLKMSLGFLLKCKTHKYCLIDDKRVYCYQCIKGSNMDDDLIVIDSFNVFNVDDLLHDINVFIDERSELDKSTISVLQDMGEEIINIKNLCSEIPFKYGDLDDLVENDLSDNPEVTQIALSHISELMKTSLLYNSSFIKNICDYLIQMSKAMSYPSDKTKLKDTIAVTKGYLINIVKLRDQLLIEHKLTDYELTLLRVLISKCL